MAIKAYISLLLRNLEDKNSQLECKFKYMYRTAQYGLAVHWDYKLKAKETLSFDLQVELSSNDELQHFNWFSFERPFNKISCSSSKFQLKI